MLLHAGADSNERAQPDLGDQDDDDDNYYYYDDDWDSDYGAAFAIVSKACLTSSGA
jgi:hypothetical protein